MIEHPDKKDLQEARDWAHSLITGDEKYFILDTETTGLESAEIVDICVMSRHGQPLLDTFIKPTIPIPSSATRIHGITDEMVADAPTFPDIYPRLKQLIEGKKVIICNKAFDCKIIRYCCLLHSLEPIEFFSECAMLWYAQYHGQYNSYYGNYTWQKLPGGGEHRALADCRAVYRLLNEMSQPLNLTPTTEYQQFPPIQLACKWERLGQFVFLWKSKRGVRIEIDVKFPVFSTLKDGQFAPIFKDADEPDIDGVPF